MDLVDRMLQPNRTSTRRFALGIIANWIVLICIPFASGCVLAMVLGDTNMIKDTLYHLIFQESPVYHADLDNTILGDTGHLPIPSHARQRLLPHLRTHSHIGPFIQVGSGLSRNVQRDMRAAVSFGEGLEPEVEQRIEDGTMDFEDFMKAMTLVNQIQVRNNALRIDTGPDFNINEQEAKLTAFRKILSAMTTEERSTPALFFDDVQVGERISRISETSGQDEPLVERFLFQFYAMREMETRLIKGDSFEAIQNDLKKGPRPRQLQATPLWGNPAPANRAQRRAAKKNKS